MYLLRPYQLEALRRIRAEFAAGHRTVLVVMATGTGKTVTFATLADEYLRLPSDVLILSQKIVLVEQMADEVSAVTGSTCFIEQAENTAPMFPSGQGKGRVISASIQSLTPARLNRIEFDPSRFGLLIIDEAHHATEAQYRRAIEHFSRNPHCKILGVTATPRRRDRKALGKVFEVCPFVYDIWDAVEDGYLVPPFGETVQVQSLDLRGIERDGLDFRDADLEKLLTEEGPLHEIGAACLDKAGSRPTVIFTAGVAHARLLAEVLNRRRGAICAESIDGRQPKSDVRRALDDFKAGRFQYLTNCNMATEGFDAPACACVAMARPTESHSLAVQMVGRGTRTLPGVLHGDMTTVQRKAAIASSAKPDLLVLDFAGNTRHKLANIIDALGGRFGFGVRALAQRRLPQAGGDAMKALVYAREEILSGINRKIRAKFKPSVLFKTMPVNLFEGDAPERQEVAPIGRGGATDKMIAGLVDMGYRREVVKDWSAGKAGAILKNVRKQRLGLFMAKRLEAAGISPLEVPNYYAAVEQLKASGHWQ